MNDDTFPDQQPGSAGYEQEADALEYSSPMTDPALVKWQQDVQRKLAVVHGCSVAMMVLMSIAAAAVIGGLALFVLLYFLDEEKPYVAVLVRDIYDIPSLNVTLPAWRMVEAALGKHPTVPQIIPAASGAYTKRVVTLATIVSVVDQLYDMGVRVFIGPLSSGELTALQSWALAHPNATFISTSSTASALDRVDTFFRISDNDTKLTRWLLMALVSGLPKLRELRCFAAANDPYAQGFVQDLQKQVGSTALRVTVATSFDQMSNAPDVLNAVLYVDQDAAVQAMAASKMPASGCQILLGDTAMGMPIAPGTNAFNLFGQHVVFAAASYHAQSTMKLAQRVTGVESPHIANMLTAAWMAFDIMQNRRAGKSGKGRDTGANYLQGAQGPAAVGAFDQYGNPADPDFMLQQLVPASVSGAVNGALTWFPVQQVGVLPGQGQFTASFTVASVAPRTAPSAATGASSSGGPSAVIGGITSSGLTTGPGLVV